MEKRDPLDRSLSLKRRRTIASHYFEGHSSILLRSNSSGALLSVNTVRPRGHNHRSAQSHPFFGGLLILDFGALLPIGNSPAVKRSGNFSRGSAIVYK